MFIRRTPTRRNADGVAYRTFRLVETRREGRQVRQTTLLNLGSAFELPETLWPDLCVRIHQLLGQRDDLLATDLPEAIETLAQALAARLIAGRAEPLPEREFVEVDIASLEWTQPRCVGVEHVGLHALAQLEFEPLLASLGINAVTRAMILALVVARMAAPGSERAAWRWLNESSALDELLGLSCTDLSLMRLYRAGDVLLKHREAIEAALFERVRTLFGLETTLTLYDLTNTCFEGAAAHNPKTRRGHSKEKRTDCPLLTLGLILDGSGFVQRSRVFDGNAVEGRTLEGMLTDLAAPAGALVVMDRGIATQANLAWLKERGRYRVMSREAQRMAPEGETTLATAEGETLQVIKVRDEAAGEVRLYCHSPGREKKESAITRRFCDRFEAGRAKLAEGLAKPRGEKRPERLWDRIGKLKERCHGVGRHDEITLETQEAGAKATALQWAKQPVAGTMRTDPGVYCLRSSEGQWDEEKLWRTYTMLADLEGVFRSLKSELGLRPVYHHKEGRSDAHLFITVLAYQAVQVIRRQLREKGIRESWTSLRATLSVQRRVTASFARKDGGTLHVRRATRPKAALQAIYTALRVETQPGETVRSVV